MIHKLYLCKIATWSILHLVRQELLHMHGQMK